MEFKQTQKKNAIRLVGRIKAVDVVDGLTKDGVPTIYGTITVAANDSEYSVNFFESKTWSSEKENPKYKEIPALQNDTIVSLSCELQGNKFIGNDGTLITTNRLRLGFINRPLQTDQEGLTFDIVGVVLSPLKEVRDKEDNVTHYALTLGQAQYKLNYGWSVIQLSVEANNTAAINYMQSNFTPGATVRPTGHGKATIRTREVRTEAAFGADKVETYQDHIYHYFVDSALMVAEADFYTEAQIKALNEATEAYNANLKEENSAPAAPAADKPSSASALFGFSE